MAAAEPRTFRNWQAIAYFGAGTLSFALIGSLVYIPLWYASIPLALVLLGVTRQHVIVSGTDVELHGMVRYHRVALSQVEDVSILFSRGHFGWRVRLHCGAGHVDTFSFLNLAGFRFFAASFSTPPPDAPAPVKELHALILARLAPTASGNTGSAS